MFQQFKNIDTAFRQIRVFTLCVVACCTLLTALGLYYSYRLTRTAQERIYILANGKAFAAQAGDRTENIAVEARDHVRTFHEAFFNLDPDDQVITAHLTKALYLADGSAQKVYQSLKENNYYTGLISGNVSQQLTVDSITVSTQVYPYPFRCQATQKIIRPSTIVYRTLLTEGVLRTVGRSDNNPHGFLIERWTTLENKDLKTQIR